MNKFYTICFFLALAVSSFSQSTLMSQAYQWSNTVQDSSQNKWMVELPSGHLWANVAPFGLGNVSEQLGQSLLVNFGFLEADYKDLNMNMSASIQYGALHRRFNNLWIGLGVENNIEVGATMPADMFKLLHLGNANEDARNLNLGFDLDYINYLKRYISIGYQKDRWIFGGQLGWLTGNEHMHADVSNLNLTTEAVGYDLALDTDLELQTTELLTSTEDGYDISFDRLKRNIFDIEHMGISVDLWADYQLNDQWLFRSRLDNAGIIFWEGQQFTKKDVVAFDGVDLQDILINDNEIDFQDTIAQFYQMEESDASYTSGLGYQVSVGAEYTYNSLVSFQGMFGVKQGFYTHILLGNLGGRYHFNDRFSALASYEFSSQNPANLGFGLRMNFKHFKLDALAVNPWNYADILLARYSNVHINSIIAF